MNALKHTLSLSLLLASFWTVPVLAADVRQVNKKPPLAWGVMAPRVKAVMRNGLI